MTILIEWIVRNWRVVGGIAVVAVVWTVIFNAFLKGKDASTPQPAPPVVQVQTIDTTATQSTSIVKSDSVVKRKVKVKVTLPPETVIGDSTCTIEVVVEDSSGNEVAVEEVKVEERRLSESVIIDRQEVMPVVEHERVLGVIAGAGYLIPDNDVVPHVGLSLRVYKPVYLCASAGWHDEVIGIGGIAVKVGNLFGLKILLGAGYSSDKQGVISLALAF